MSNRSLIRGKAWRFGDDVDTDAIIPARYLNTSDPDELAEHCMEDADPKFPSEVASGDIIVGGKNFGCGSSREHAPIAIKASSVSCVIAGSFARIFYRSAINQGLILVECPDAVDAYRDGDEVDVDPEGGVITVAGTEFRFPKLPPQIIAIRDAGGLLAYVRKELAGKGAR